MPDIVNPQITDAVTASAVASPASARAMLYQATAQALALAAHNAVVAQQNANTVLLATTTQGVAALYGTVAASIAARIAAATPPASPPAPAGD